jgi:hypothetical protein
MSDCTHARARTHTLRGTRRTTALPGRRYSSSWNRALYPSIVYYNTNNYYYEDQTNWVTDGSCEVTAQEVWPPPPPPVAGLPAVGALHRAHR